MRNIHSKISTSLNEENNNYYDKTKKLAQNTKENILKINNPK